MDNRTKSYQMRATLEDTQRYQDELFALFRKKIRFNTALSLDEKEVFSGLAAKAMLSQAYKHCYYVTEDKKRIDLGSIRFLCLNLLDVSGSKLNIVEPSSGHKYKVDISEIWKVLYTKCKETSQSALREAIKMSKEIPKKEESTALEYSSED